MKPFKSTLLGIAFAAGIGQATAGSTVYTWNGNQPVPDNNASGVAFSFYLNTPTPELISSVSVNLQTAGGWNGDLYGYLSHGSGFAVLLNRMGRTASNPGGSSSSGMDVTFTHDAATDIHTFLSTPVFGNFAPDGRHVSPFIVVDTDARNAGLDSFVGLQTGGFWTLFLADVSPLAVATVQSWTVTINTMPVPEPSALALLSVGAAVLILRQRRKLQP